MIRGRNRKSFRPATTNNNDCWVGGGGGWVSKRENLDGAQKKSQIRGVEGATHCRAGAMAAILEA